MDLSKVSPPVRIFALVGALVAVAGLLLMFVTGRSATSEPIVVPPPAPRPAAAAEPAAPAPAAPAKPAAPAPAASKATGAPAPLEAAEPAPPASGLPRSVDAALKQHEVVVVSLYAPGARVDRVATAEAKAGASLGGVGFVALNVLDEAEARPLLEKLGVLEDPSVLVFRRGGDLAVKLAGFADRQTVAQAAANAVP